MLPVMKYGLIVGGGCAVATAVVVITYFSISKAGAETCMTLDSRPGLCVEWNTCHPPGVNLSVSGEGSTPSSIQPTLNFTRCRDSSDKPLVCCPSEVLKTSGQKPVQVKSLYPVYQPPPNVTGHPNIGLLPENCGPNGDDQIMGGRITGLYQYPWMALIMYRNGSITYNACGGTVINNRYILTAAHCVTNLEPNVTVAGVRVGDHNLTSDFDCEGRSCAPAPQDFFQVELIPHSAYSTLTRQNDIALIRLEEDINFKLANSQPICLPVTNDWANMNLTDLDMTVAGWGLTEKDNYTSDVMLEATIPVLDNRQCESLYRNSKVVISHNQVCAGGQEGIDTCNGDSGGPLKMLSRTEFSLVFVQYGIVSIGPEKCGTLGKPGIYTRVAYYMDWILDNLKLWPVSLPVEDYEY